jgi:hypothetical protein
LTYISLNNSLKSIIIVLILFLSSCSLVQSDTKGEKLISIIDSDFKIQYPVDKIFILNGYGCITCNKIFSNFLSTYNSKNTIFIISDNGQFFNRGFVQSDSVLIIKDYKNLLIRHKIIKPSPAFIRMRNSKIDTIIHFSINNIETQLKYITTLD